MAPLSRKIDYRVTFQFRQRELGGVGLDGVVEQLFAGTARRPQSALSRTSRARAPAGRRLFAPRRRSSVTGPAGGRRVPVSRATTTRLP